MTANFLKQHFMITFGKIVEEQKEKRKKIKILWEVHKP